VRQVASADSNSVQEAATKSTMPRHEDLIQDARWRWGGRAIYGFFVYPAFLGAMTASLWQPNSLATECGLFAGFALPIVLGEWRVRRMGFRVCDEGMELVRALNCSKVRWEDIDGFTAIRRGIYGNRKVWLTRRGRGKLPVPTVFVMKVTWPLPKGEPGLRWPGGGTNDALDFLERQLAMHKVVSPPAGPG
jgi:hypothetical protein